jgi:hypothetical protein
MSFKETDSNFELRSGEAVLTYSRGKVGPYRAAYGVRGKTVFTSQSFCGGNFDFFIDSVAPQAGVLQLGGPWESAGQVGRWAGQARALAENPGWFKLTADFTLSEPLTLDRADFAPTLTLSLDDPRQPDQTVVVSQPTEHNPPVPWLRSNDLPAAYLWDAPTGTETLIYPDLEGCDWFQREGLNRLADYRCTLAEDRRTFGFLLRPDSATRPSRIPAGTYHLNFRLYLGPKPARPNSWQAVRNLIEGCAALLPGGPVIPLPAGCAGWKTLCAVTWPMSRNPAS